MGEKHLVLGVLTAGAGQGLHSSTRLNGPRPDDHHGHSRFRGAHEQYYAMRLKCEGRGAAEKKGIHNSFYAKIPPL